MLKQEQERMMTRNRAKMLEIQRATVEEQKDDSPEQIQQEEDEGIDNRSDASVNPNKFDGTELVTGLFFGGEGCGADHRGRETRGITHVLSIITPFEQSFEPDPDMVLAGHWRIFDRENRPTADILNVLDDCVEFINEALGERGKICVLSLEGVSRSAAVCIAYLMKTLGMTLRSAHDLVQAHRPEVAINRGFWRQLVAYEEYTRGCVSMVEDDLPGAVLFEREDLDRITQKFRMNHSLANESPLSPTRATGIAMMSIGSPNGKRKAFDWRHTQSPEETERNQRVKSPRNVDESVGSISSF